MTKKVYKSLNKHYPYDRGYCSQCGNITTSKHEDVFICKKCQMALEDKLNEDEKTILKLVRSSQLSPRELRERLTSTRPESKKQYDHPHVGRFKIGIIADTHIGQEKFDEELFKYAGDVFRKAGVKDVYHAGDILEGASGRDGQCFELTHIGFEQQLAYAAELFEKYFKGLQVYGIEGNHDLWYKQKNNAGVSVGRELEARTPNFHYLGEMEADVKLGPNCIMKLFHANDGTAYANSYKMQKLVESFEGGAKPHIAIEGHYHKALYQFIRGVHCIDGGTVCGQTGWMRGKKIPAHKGFWLLDIDLGKKGIKSFGQTFYPAYD
jgi:predicted phosphodiesterase